MYLVNIALSGVSRSIYVTCNEPPRIKEVNGKIEKAIIKSVEFEGSHPLGLQFNRYREQIAYIDWSSVVSITHSELKETGKTVGREERSEEIQRIKFLIWLSEEAQDRPHWALVQDYLGWGQKKSAAFVRGLSKKGLILAEKQGKRTLFGLTQEGFEYLEEMMEEGLIYREERDEGFSYSLRPGLEKGEE